MPVIKGLVKDENDELASNIIVRAYRNDNGLYLGEAPSGDNTPFLAGDALYDSVKLLLHFNGDDNSTTIIDNSSAPKNITTYGIARIKTDQSKFEGASCYFDGASYISAPSNMDFAPGASDFSLEMWVRPTVFNAVNMLYDTRSGTGGFGFVLYITGSGTLTLYSVATGTIGSIPLNTWTRIEISRTGTTLKMFLNDIEHYSGSVSVNFDNNGFFMGRTHEANANYFTGNIDELRLTKGVARHNAAGFALETYAFPNKRENSGGSIGEYIINTEYSDPVFVVASNPLTGSTTNDLILKTTPIDIEAVSTDVFNFKSLIPTTLPNVSDVRAGVSVGNTLGTAQIPNPANVALGIPVDNTVGTAILTADLIKEAVWDTLITTLNTEDSVGARVKNIATISSVGAQLASLRS